MKDGFRYVGCVNRGIISLDLELPSSVQWLHLAVNSISTLSNYIFLHRRLVQVEKLDLSRNTIGNIERHALRGMDSLVWLQLSSNHIYHLDPHTFESTKSLVTLDLSSNPLRRLPEPFLIAPSVQVLLIRSCNLGYISPESLMELRSLRSLDLSNNQLIKLQLATVQNIPTISQIYIAGNHLQCGEETHQLLKYLKSRRIDLQDHGCEALTLALEMDTSGESNEVSSPELSPDIKTTGEEKFQRMVIDPKTTTYKTVVFTDDTNSYNDGETNDRYLKMCQTVASIPLPDSYNDKGSGVYDWLILAIVFVTGLSLGALLAYTSVALYSLYWKCQKRRSQRETQTRVQHVQHMFVPSLASFDPNAPPPNYYQLFNLSPNR